MMPRRPGGCPKTEDFIGTMLGETGAESRQAFFRHALRCPVCRPKLQILSVIKAELSARKDMVPETRLTREETRVLKRFAADELRLMRPAGRRLSFRPLQAAAAAAAAVIAVGLGYIYLHNALRSQFAVRGSPLQEFCLREPGPRLREAPADFSWTDVSGRQEFRFILIDDNLNTLYEIVTPSPRLRLPEEYRQKLEKSKTYLWTVIALDDDGRELATASRVFKVE